MKLVFVVKVLVVVLVIVNVVYFWPPARLLVLAAVGRSQCPLSQTLGSHENTKRDMQIWEWFQRENHVIHRDPSGFDLWKTPRGHFWTVKEDSFLAYVLADVENNIYTGGEYGIRGGDTVLDCGAHVGVFTRKALEAGACLVVAIEPAPENLECLRRNLVQEITSGRVLVYPKGVWDRDDLLSSSS